MMRRGANRRWTRLELDLGGLTPRWGDISWSEDDAYAAVVDGLRRDKRSLTWMDAWARLGVASREGVARALVDPALVVLKSTHTGWWKHGLADGSGIEGRELRGAVSGLPGSSIDPFGGVAGAGARDCFGGVPELGAEPGSGGAGHLNRSGGSGSASPGGLHGNGEACACHQWPDASETANLRIVEWRLDLLRRAARARAARAVGPGGVLDGAAALLLCGDTWLSSRSACGIAPRWVRAVAFAGAVRASAGRLNLAASPLCALCGLGPVGAFDEWVSAHPLSSGGGA